MENTNPLTGEKISDTDVKSLAELCELKQDLEAQVKQIEEALSEKKQELRRVTEVDIPDKMAELGMESFTTTSGTRIEVNSFYAANITQEKARDAFKWLRDNGHGAIIKREIVTRFGKGQEAIADAFVELLGHKHMNKFVARDKESVHPQTLKAFVREQIESGEDIPLDLLGVHIGKKAVIKRS